MGEIPLKKLEKFLWVIFALLGLVVITGLVLLLVNRDSTEENQGESAEVSEDDYVWEAGLSDSTIWLPRNCNLYESIPDITFQDAGGNTLHYSDFLGKPTVLIFWASWCEDCKEQMPRMSEYMKLAEGYGEIQFLFLNRLDGVKETKESAEAYYGGLGLSVPCYYDVNEDAYETLGIRNIPTMLFLDEAGRIITWSPKQIVKDTVFQSYLQNLCEGNSKALADFVIEQLMDENGGIHTEYVPDNESATKDSAVLSESQGLMLEYAVMTENQELFDRTMSYINQVMLQDGLVSWCVDDGEVSAVNALIDDMRIYGALLQADVLWGGYGEILKDMEIALEEKAISKKGYTDFYDLKSGQSADVLTLCYIDLETMDALAEEGKTFEKAGENAGEILINGQISEEFPLYYCRYNYDAKEYFTDDLNMAEALVTLLHLAEAECLPENTHRWLKQQMAQGGIAARYDVQGQVVEGYQYESTAIYALLAMIASELGDEELQGQALRKMEKMRIRDTELSYNGAFGLEDGSGITSFDQLLPLLVYASFE